MLLAKYKINLALKLCKFLDYQISLTNCDNLLLKVRHITTLLINILHQCLINSNTIFDRKTNIKIAIAKRLCLIVKQLYRDSIIYCEWKVYTDLCDKHPHIYESLINKNIDAKTAYKWCSESYSNCYHNFENKLTNLLNADEFRDIATNACLTKQDLFVKTLVTILSQYKTYSIVINGLNEKLDTQQKTIKNLKEKMLDNQQTLDGMQLHGQIVELRPLMQLPKGKIPSKTGKSLKLITTLDGDGVGGQITLFNGEITVVDGGNNYKMNDIVYIKHLKKTYFFRVIDLQQKHVFAIKIDLDDITVCVPIWIRIYKMLYPCKFDICIIQKIKDEIEEYGIQYVILKHQCISEAYEKGISNAF